MNGWLTSNHGSERKNEGWGLERQELGSFCIKRCRLFKRLWRIVAGFGEEVGDLSTKSGNFWGLRALRRVLPRQDLPFGRLRTGRLRIRPSRTLRTRVFGGFGAMVGPFRLKRSVLTCSVGIIHGASLGVKIIFGLRGAFDASGSRCFGPWAVLRTG